MREESNLEVTMNFYHLMKKAYDIASTSPDPSTQTGAVVQTKDGLFWSIYTSWPQNYEDRDYKYKHAESGAIYQCAKAGSSTQRAVMVSPCLRCAIAIQESGIGTLVLHKQRMEEQSSWSEEIKEDSGYPVFGWR